MNVKVTVGKVRESDADAIIVGLFQDAPLEGVVQAVDEALQGAVRELMDVGDLDREAEQLVVLYPRGMIPARRLILVGLGPRDDFDLDTLRRVSARAIQKARDLQARRVASALHAPEARDAGDVGSAEVEAAAQAIAEGSLLGVYDYRGQKSDTAPETLPQVLELFVPHERDVPAAERGVVAGQATATGVALTRDLVNLPPNICTPSYLAEIATQVAKDTGLRVEALGKKQMATLKMGALLAVAQGSDTPPRLIILEHNADRAGELDTIVLVGKGVTFDTGGYSLKNREGMATMKGDMAGAAAVIGAMRAIGALNLPLHVVGLAPASDNMISGHAYRPQEVVTASNGVTIEIISTDAEGRMLLADALVYAKRFNPTAVVDIATLTGTCAAALGRVAAGLFSTDDGLRDALLSAADATAEKLWPLPLFSEYEKAISSNTADVKNSGGRWGGIGSSAIFLKHFVDYPVWAHIDMAGLAFETQGGTNASSKNATGFGVRLLTEFARRWAE